MAGDPRGLRETSVLSVDPNNYFPLVLSNGEGLPSTSKVKWIKVIQHNRLVDHLGLFRSMDSLQTSALARSLVRTWNNDQ